MSKNNIDHLKLKWPDLVVSNIASLHLLLENSWQIKKFAKSQEFWEKLIHLKEHVNLIALFHNPSCVCKVFTFSFSRVLLF